MNIITKHVTRAYKIIKSTDQLWNNYLYRFPQKYHDINYTSQYHKLMEAKGEGEAELFVIEDGEKLFFHPYMINQIKNIGSVKIEREIYDIKSVFGYTGPIANTTDEKFIQDSNDLFEEICTKRGIIIELIRFNPLLENHFFQSKSQNIKIFPLKEYVFIDLTQSEEITYNNYKHSLRRNITRAETFLNWDWKIVNEKEIFLKICSLLQKQMQELNFGNMYIGNEKYFNILYEFTSDSALVFCVYDKKSDKIIAAEIFVFNDNDSKVYFLHSVRDVYDSRSSAVHNYLINKAYLHLRSKGFKTILFGGGRSNSSEDSLLRFKKNYSRSTKSFYLGKRVFNEEIYRNIIHIWENEFPHLIDTKKDYVLKYRCTK
jgi:hypothetical protein